MLLLQPWKQIDLADVTWHVLAGVEGEEPFDIDQLDNFINATSQQAYADKVYYLDLKRVRHCVTHWVDLVFLCCMYLGY